LEDIAEFFGAYDSTALVLQFFQDTHILWEAIYDNFRNVHG
jgi:hypothetical protein